MEIHRVIISSVPVIFMNNCSLTHASACAALDNGSQGLNVRQQCTYALPVMGIIFLMGPIALLQGIYATYFGVSLTAIAMVLLIARLFDGVTDPLIGYLSDRYHARTGSRKIFIACGGVAITITGYFLYVPVDPQSLTASTQVSVAYFLIFYLLFFLSSTLFEIPHMAWASELTATSKERNSIFSWRTVMISIGGLLFYVVPLSPFFETNEITPQTLQWAVLIGVFLILPALLISLKFVPNQQDKSHRTRSRQKYVAPLRLSSLPKNKPLLLFLAPFIVFALAAGMYWGLSFIYVNSYLNLGDRYALVTLTQLVAGTLSIKCWHLLTRFCSKRFIWSFGTTLFLLGIIILGHLEPNEVNLWPLLVANILLGCGGAAGQIMAPSILSDVIDYHYWKFKADCSASFFALFQMTLKAGLAAGGALALLAAGWYGFDPSYTADFSSEAVTGLRLAAIWLPALLFASAALLIFLNPINEHRHTVIRRAIEANSMRLKRVDKATQEPTKLSVTMLPS